MSLVHRLGHSASFVPSDAGSSIENSSLGSTTTARRAFLRWLAVTFGAGPVIGASASPSKTLTFVVPVPAGGGMDATARVLASRLRESLGTVVVENKPGASLRLGLHAVRTAPANGSTFLYAPSSPFTVYPHVYRHLGFDPEGDFAPVASAVSFEFALGVAASSRIESVAQYLEAARAAPQRNALYGVPGAGSSAHFVGAALAATAGIDLTYVPYRGSAPLMQDLVGDRIVAACNVAGEFAPFRAAGKVKVLATTGATRSRLMPDVPTFAELGFTTMTFDEQFGLFAPKGTPETTIRQINTAVAKALGDTSTQQQLAALGYTVHVMSESEFASKLTADRQRWGPIVKATGFTLND